MLRARRAKARRRARTAESKASWMPPARMAAIGVKAKAKAKAKAKKAAMKAKEKAKSKARKEKERAKAKAKKAREAKKDKTKKLKRRSVNSLVLKGSLPRTKGGLKAEKLVKNAKTGRVSSKKMFDRGMKTWKANLGPWVEAMLKARAELGLVGMVGCKKGTPFYTKARELYDAHKANSAA
mmetsp:Transcript_9845/g.22015  ORF Transcript_9845/g.22015 Transcript_9845/m.22015 type:complete len:181 (+) Transcript_9845:1288-1830(+)